MTTSICCWSARVGSAPQPRVICLDYEHDSGRLARLLASCDAFVHANDQEPFGLVVLEALAAGLPVVGPARGGVAELIDDSVGQKAVHATAAGLAEAIDALFARDLGALSAAARDRALGRHSWDRTFHDLTSVYGELLGRDLGGEARSGGCTPDSAHAGTIRDSLRLAPGPGAAMFRPKGGRIRPSGSCRCYRSPARRAGG